jgi:hypothetical protein
MEEYVIWKWHFPLAGIFELDMPINAEILCVQTQHDEGVLWALVLKDSKIVKRKFRIIPTGLSIETKPGKYIGTFQLVLGNIVFHLFEIN